MAARNFLCSFSCLIFFPFRYLDNVCQLDKEVGPGRAGFPRWYFNKETSQCEQFIWGGIGGNKNNFPTKEKCEEKCGELIKVYKLHLRIALVRFIVNSLLI